MATIYSLEILLFLFGTSLLFHAYKLDYLKGSSVYCYGDREDILIRDFLECEFILCALNS